MIDRLRQAMAAIDEQFRAVLVLRDLQGLDYHQVAQTLDVPLGTVKSRLFRARLALRQEMERMEAQAGPGRGASASVEAGDPANSPTG